MDPIAAIEAACDPNKTKALLMGEFHLSIQMDEEEDSFKVSIDWTTVKEIQAAILEQARLNMGWRCSGCGSTKHILWLRDHGHISCCPERELIPPNAPRSAAGVSRSAGLTGWASPSTGATMPRILDPCCGPRSMWLDPHHPDAIYGDRRSETITVTDRSHGRQDGQRVLRIEPDEIMDFRALPFPDESFALVAFDPPHIKRSGPRSWLAARYGRLTGTWQEDLAAGFRECFRVLTADGTLVFKWNETHIKLSEILPLSPHPPLFGQISGRTGMTHWLVFMKPNSAISSTQLRPNAEPQQEPTP